MRHTAHAYQNDDSSSRTEESMASLSPSDSCRVQVPSQETRSEQRRSLTPTAARLVTDQICYSLKGASCQSLQADLGRALIAKMWYQKVAGITNTAYVLYQDSFYGSFGQESRNFFAEQNQMILHQPFF
ncbi:hypothetical protein NDU88_008517 [Pleurodeles waltl]|uniref:Uncharacterized protein n=1 Tax=Pleurodeles waltl TaxID=8319 RepID=A0AAV7RTG5_PLEWA|nr:hypothetical protein NDU88_008517 [Pleurodeles waltl]